MNAVISFFNSKRLPPLFIKLTGISFVFVLLVNLFVGMLIYQNPLLALADIANLLFVLLAACVMGGCAFWFNKSVVWLKLRFAQRSFYNRMGSLFFLCMLVIPILLIACEQQSISLSKRSLRDGTLSGVISNPSTQLSAKYESMKTEDVQLVMNGEVLTHTDIPLGERFYIVNEDVSGLEVKAGNVSVGCLLEIKDEEGNTIFLKEDLFSSNDIFEKEKAKMLRCIISTGRPMKAGHYYTIRAVFRDKWGKGKIENRCRIRMTDMQ